MTVQMIIRIDPEIKKKLTRLARMEGKNTSQKIREIINDYINERDIGKYIDDLWNRIGEKFRSKGVKRADITKTIKEARRKDESGY